MVPQIINIVYIFLLYRTEPVMPLLKLEAPRTRFNKEEIRDQIKTISEILTLTTEDKV
jgi:hypothetical protein